MYVCMCIYSFSHMDGIDEGICTFHNMEYIYSGRNSLSVDCDVTDFSVLVSDCNDNSCFVYLFCLFSFFYFCRHSIKLIIYVMQCNCRSSQGGQSSETVLIFGTYSS